MSGMLKENLLCVIVLTCAYKKNHNVLATKDVFLGGSCNPTTWRTDIVIPMLKELNISYHNFQVDKWKPELVRLENEAKETSRILLWVIGTSTRNSVGIIEIAEFAATKPDRLVVVMSPYEKGQKILNDTVSDEEYYELMNAQLMLQYFMDLKELPTFTSIPSSIMHVSKVLKGEIKLSNSFESNDIIRFKQLNDTNRPSPWNPFCKEHVLPSFTKSLDSKKRHLYFGVAGKDIEWLEKTAAPLLTASGLRFYRPYTDNYNAQALPAELQHIENSQIILLMVSSHTRGLGIMTLGAHLIGLHRHQLIICVQDIPQAGVIDGEKLSETAIKDYNRARTYLKDMIKRAGLPIYDNLHDGLHQAIKLTQKTKKTV